MGQPETAMNDDFSKLVIVVKSFLSFGFDSNSKKKSPGTSPGAFKERPSKSVQGSRCPRRSDLIKGTNRARRGS